MARFSSRCGHCGEWHETEIRVCPSTRLEITAEAPQVIAVAPKDARLGQTIQERYLVRRRLGGGTLGPVYLGEHIDFQRTVAIRFLEPDHASRDVATRLFHGEARTAWALSHPNLCDVLDMALLDDGTPCIVMEHLPGESLRHAMTRLGPLPISAAVDIMTQVLSALSMAHARGIPHRDLRPENIWLAERLGCPPHVKLLDMGLGKLVSPSKLGARWAADGIVAEMPFYLPPERARGEQGTDERGDLFACGVIFFELLTGQKPFFAGSFQELMLSIATGSFTPASALREDLSAPFDAVFDKALAVDRDVRYDTAQLFQEDLRGLYELTRYQKMARGEEFSQVLVAEAPVSSASANATTTEEQFTLTGTATAAAVPAPAKDHESGARRLPAPPPRPKPSAPEPRARRAPPSSSRRDLGPARRPLPTAPAPLHDDDEAESLTIPPAMVLDDDRSLVTSQTQTFSPQDAQAALAQFEEEEAEEPTDRVNLSQELMDRMRATKAAIVTQQLYDDEEEQTMAVAPKARLKPKPKKR